MVLKEDLNLCNLRSVKLHFFMVVSNGFPSKALGFPHVLQGFPSGFLHALQGLTSGFPLKVWVSLTFCKGFPRLSVQRFSFPSCCARVSLGFLAWVLGVSCVLKGFPSGFPSEDLGFRRVSQRLPWVSFHGFAVSLVFCKGFLR